jgi:hypothetical protein
MRSHHGPWFGVGLFVSVLLWISGPSAARASAQNEPEAVRTDLAFCRTTAQAGCQCSFATLETPFTFAEAAGVVATYYQEFPDERYYRLLERFLRQCAGETSPTPLAQPLMMNQIGQASPPPVPSNAPSVQNGVQP